MAAESNLQVQQAVPATSKRAGNSQVTGFAIAQIGPITMQTQTGSSVVRVSGISLPRAYEALQGQFGATHSPLDVPQPDNVEERKALFRQKRLANRQRTAQIADNKTAPASATSEHDSVGSVGDWEQVQPIDQAAEFHAYNIVDPMLDGASEDCKLDGEKDCKPDGEVDDESSIGTYEDPELVGPNSEWRIIASDHYE